MKKYTIHLDSDRKVTLECMTPRAGKERHDLICQNDAGEHIAYFYTYVYWTEAEPEFAKKVPRRCEVGVVNIAGVEQKDKTDG